jgi:hypothetical protein
MKTAAPNSSSVLPRGFGLPSFIDQDAVLALFDDEDLREWSSEWPSFDDDDDPRAALLQAIRQAKQGQSAALIRLAEKSLIKRARGRPKGSRVSKSKRVQASPIHRAASMVSLAKFILRNLYPKQPLNQIYDRSLLVVEYIWNDRRAVTATKLSNYLARSKQNRRRLA